MKLFPTLLIVFLAVPLAEIWLLIKVGGVVGAVPTVALVVLTAVIGALLVRAQGLATLGRAQLLLHDGELPAVELLEGVLILIAGALLLTPGFLTDALGFALLVPVLRRQLLAACVRRGLIQLGPQPPPAAGPGSSGRTLEGDFDRVDNDAPR